VTAKKPLKKEAKKSTSKRGAVETSGFVQIQRPINLHLNLNLRCARDVRSSLERALAGLARDGEPLIATPAPGHSGAMQLRLDACDLNDSIYLYLSRTQAKRLVARLTALELSVSR